MTFDSRTLPTTPGTLLSEDRYRSVQLGVLFRRITCYRCDFTDIYKYAAKQIRRKSEEEAEKGGKLSPDQKSIWLSIPRYAEIPQTLCCRNCGEILGLYTECIF